MIGIDTFTLAQFYKWLYGNDFYTTLIDCKNMIMDTTGKIVYSFEHKHYDCVQVYPIA